MKLTMNIFDKTTKEKIFAWVVIKNNKNQLINSKYTEPGFPCDGSFELSLPAGKYDLFISHNDEYKSFSTRLNIKKDITLNIFLEHKIKMNHLGWYSLDAHCHLFHGEKEYSPTIKDAAVIARAKGLNFFFLCQYWNTQDTLFSARKLQKECDKYKTKNFFLSWNLESPKTLYGHCWTLGMKNWGNSKKEREFFLKNLPNFVIQEKIKQKDGLIFYSHPARWWLEEGGKKFVTNIAHELVYDTITGPTYDGIDVMCCDAIDDQITEKIWFNLLNMGYKIIGIAATDSCLDRKIGPLPGQVRTYVYTRNFSYKKLLSSIKKGNCFSTSGPFLFFTVNDKLPQSVVKEKILKFKIHAYPSYRFSDEKITFVQLIRNGKIVKVYENNNKSFKIEFTRKETEKCWYLVKVYGKREKQVAISNPIFIKQNPAPKYWIKKAKWNPKVKQFILNLNVYDLTNEETYKTFYRNFTQEGGKCHVEKSFLG